MQHDEANLLVRSIVTNMDSLTLLGPNLREVDVEAANRIAVELTPFGLSSSTSGNR